MEDIPRLFSVVSGGPGNGLISFRTTFQAMVSTWNKEGSDWTWRNTFSLWKCLSIGCLGMLWSLIPRSYLKVVWMSSWATGSRWPCLSRLFGPGDLQRFLPTSAILWFWELCLKYISSFILYIHLLTMSFHVQVWVAID